MTDSITWGSTTETPDETDSSSETETRVYEEQMK